MKYEELIGKKIKILCLVDEPNSNYNGKTGTVTSVNKDPWGDIQLWGTWGGVCIYPHIDKFEIIKEEE